LLKIEALQSSASIFSLLRGFFLHLPRGTAIWQKLCFETIAVFVRLLLLINTPKSYELR
jgi:hypothetical protein